jgi:hypothetical protein
MAFEDGVFWRPLMPERRGLHPRFSSAVEAAAKSLMVERSAFFDTLADRWPSLFPKCAARPGRWADGKLFLYVNSAPALFAVRPRLRAMKSALMAIPGAPKRLDLILEIHAPPPRRSPLTTTRSRKP